MNDDGDATFFESALMHIHMCLSIRSQWLSWTTAPQGRRPEIARIITYSEAVSGYKVT